MKVKLLLGLLLLQACFCLDLLGDTDGPWSILGYTGYAGEVVMNYVTGSSLFYWLFQATKGNILTDKAPIILWLQGGQGCSGATGLLFENVGPFNINNDTEPTPNPYSWTNEYHVIMVDYPYGSGFSFANAGYDMKNTTIQASAYLYNLLIKLNNKYPTWFNRDLYIFGDSYAGHWVPGIAYTILMNNISPGVQKVFDLKGIGIGDPFMDGGTQTQHYDEYGFSTGLLDLEEMGIIQQMQAQIIDDLNAGELVTANNDQMNLLGAISDYAGGADIYNIRYYWDSYDIGQLPNWMNLNSTKLMLHAPLNIVWQSCNPDIGYSWGYDMMTSMKPYLSYIVQNIKVIVWNSQDDYIVNSLGTQDFLSKLNWQYTYQFVNAHRQVWKVNGKIAGYVRAYNNLSFVLVLRAGHLMPHDQPQCAQDLVYRFINNEGWK